MSGDRPRPHRPALFSDLTEMIDAAGGHSPEQRAEIAAATAAVLVQAGRDGDGHDPRFVELADQVGLDTLAALWRDAEPVSLPGALWTLYLLRQWCVAAPADVVRYWRAGEPLAPADAVVAGVADFADAEAIQALPDAVLGGVYRGDLAVALDRAAAFFRVVATGRRACAASGDHDAERDATSWAERNERAASALTAAARQWRAGRLR